MANHGLKERYLIYILSATICILCMTSITNAQSNGAIEQMKKLEKEASRVKNYRDASSVLARFQALDTTGYDAAEKSNHKNILRYIERIATLQREKEISEKFNVSTDEFTGRTIYSKKVKGLSNLAGRVVKTSDGDLLLAIEFQYRGSTWLFTEGFQIKIGDELHTIPDLYMRFFLERKVVSGAGIREIITIVNADVSEINTTSILKALYEANQETIIMIRFDGRRSYSNHTLDPQERQYLRDIFDLFISLGGSFDS